MGLGLGLGLGLESGLGLGLGLESGMRHLRGDGGSGAAREAACLAARGLGAPAARVEERVVHDRVREATGARRAQHLVRLVPRAKAAKAADEGRRELRSEVRLLAAPHRPPQCLGVLARAAVRVLFEQHRGEARVCMPLPPRLGEGGRGSSERELGAAPTAGVREVLHCVEQALDGWMPRVARHDLRAAARPGARTRKTDGTARLSARVCLLLAASSLADRCPAPCGRASPTDLSSCVSFLRAGVRLLPLFEVVYLARQCDLYYLLAGRRCTYTVCTYLLPPRPSPRTVSAARLPKTPTCAGHQRHRMKNRGMPK